MEVLVLMMCSGIDIFFIVYPAEVRLHRFPGETMMTYQSCIYCLGLVITGVKEMYSRLNMSYTTCNCSPFVSCPYVKRT